MSTKFHSELSQDISLLLNDTDDYNVIIQTGEGKNSREFRAHSIILKIRSPYFKNLSTKWVVQKNNMIEIKKPNIRPTVFEIILKYIYTGEVNLTKRPGADILGLLIATDELLLEKLFRHVQNHLIKNQTAWIKQNYVHILHTISKLSSCKKLQDHCIESICLDPQPLITSKEFLSLDKDILYELFKRDDLQVEETVAWDYLMKWSIEQTPGLGSKNNDRTKWNDNNYKALKETLSKFIPLIRFAEIPSDDFFDKVRPYKAVLPHHIYEELVLFYYKDTLPKSITLPPRVGKVKVESKLINPKQANIIACWIERKNEKNVSLDKKYKFDLLYHSKQSGLNINTFRNKCNNQGACLVLAKSQQSAKIYGGYNPIGFTNANGQWRGTTESFIFSFENSEDIQNMKISRINNNYNTYAIYDYNSYGFSFGNTFNLNSDKRIYCSNNGYYDGNLNNVLNPHINQNGYFIPEDTEAFKITAT
ncbi:BTB-domain-containing protein [Rhizophagus irregularis]|uniref:BTB-domain-containing protein n=1 Tax=Rhizophagus irregularis TaxID=588596 RepID=A0A2I1G4H3_9GLOM|nr:BTB-domain-containing protein [Rhizophagus irregularis]